MKSGRVFEGGQKKSGRKKLFSFTLSMTIFLGGFLENLSLRRISLSNPMRSGERHIEKIEKLAPILSIFGVPKKSA